jgi:hypothetical protein
MKCKHHRLQLSLGNRDQVFCDDCGATWSINSRVPKVKKFVDSLKEEPNG